MQRIFIIYLLLSFISLYPKSTKASILPLHSTHKKHTSAYNPESVLVASSKLSSNEFVVVEETVKNEQLIELIKEKENQLEQIREQIKHQNRNSILLVIITILFIFTAIIALRERLYRRKTDQQLAVQKHEAQKQRSKSDKKARSFTESLNYAQRIQKAILRNSLHIQDILPSSFILLYPKNIVSGDFYWIQEKNSRILFALADCTGHGVPGALMSIIGTYGLNRVVNELNITSPGEVLHHVNLLFEDSLKQRTSTDIFDGMDIGLCSYNPKSMELKYSGANLPLLICRSNLQPPPSSVILTRGKSHTLYSVKPTKQAIGSFSDNKTFANHSIILAKDDVIYLHSDGYTDQFGGTDGRKFKSQQLYQLLVNISELPIDEQKQIIESTFIKWKGTAPQIDDVSFIGIKI